MKLSGEVPVNYKRIGPCFGFICLDSHALGHSRKVTNLRVSLSVQQCHHFLVIFLVLHQRTHSSRMPSLGPVSVRSCPKHFDMSNEEYRSSIPNLTRTHTQSWRVRFAPIQFTFPFIGSFLTRKRKVENKKA